MCSRASSSRLVTSGNSVAHRHTSLIFSILAKTFEFAAELLKLAAFRKLRREAVRDSESKPQGHRSSA